MAYNRNLIIFFTPLFIFILIGCGGPKKVYNRYSKSPLKVLMKNEKNLLTVEPIEYKSKKKQSVAQKINNYVTNFSNVAVQEMKLYFIPASITLAQGILESGMGYSRLALEANNHFGIKCHRDWKGKRIYHDDDKKGECFRVYNDPRISYRDHSLFLKTRSRYGFLFDLKLKDYKGWAKGLKKAGYATDPKYPDKLISLIERYRLDRFDKIKKNRKENNDQIEVQDAKNKTHIVKKGDTLFAISKKYQVDIKLLIEENQLNNNTIFLGQNLIIPISN